MNLHANLASKLLKQSTNRLNVYSQMPKPPQFTKDKIEQRPFLHRRRASELKGSSPISLLDGQKKILEVRPREKMKLNNCQGSSFQKVVKENPHKEPPVVIRSRLRVPTRSCQPSPARNCSREEVIPLSQRKQVNEPGHRRNQSLLINLNNNSKILKEPPVQEIKKDKKRVKIFRIDRFAKVQEQQIIPPEEMYSNQFCIMNPAIEQELFKEYLAIDKQTFGFEKQMLCGSCNVSQDTTEPHANIPKTTSEVIIPSKPTSMNKLENKQRTVTTKDSANTIAGLTTNSTSRYKGTVGLASGYSERGNFDLIELIQWSSETERNLTFKTTKKSPDEVQKAAVEPKPSVDKLSGLLQKRPIKKQPSKPVTPLALKNELSRLTKEKFKVNRSGSHGLKLRDPSV